MGKDRQPQAPACRQAQLRRRPSSWPQLTGAAPGSEASRSRHSTSARTGVRRARRRTARRTGSTGSSTRTTRLRGGRGHAAARHPRASEEQPSHHGRTVEISYLTRKGGVHAYDSLATWNHTQSSADRCGDHCRRGTAWPVHAVDVRRSRPTRRSSRTRTAPAIATSGHQLPRQVFTVYGGTLTGVSSYLTTTRAGTSDSYAHVTLTYAVPSTAAGARVTLLFGGHLAPGVGLARVGRQRRRRVDLRRPVPHPDHGRPTAGRWGTATTRSCPVRSSRPRAS